MTFMDGDTGNVPERHRRIVMGLFAYYTLEPGGLIGWLVVGLVAGWLAGLVMKGSGYGLFTDLIIGLIGAVVGGFVFGQFAFGTAGILGSIAIAFIGACILIAVVRFVSQGRARV
jgi:uncharacterized membrane protein YeaQ/YmgE (transglycosylase-associated protein family)